MATASSAASVGSPVVPHVTLRMADVMAATMAAPTSSVLASTPAGSATAASGGRLRAPTPPASSVCGSVSGSVTSMCCACADTSGMSVASLQSAAVSSSWRRLARAAPESGSSLPALMSPSGL